MADVTRGASLRERLGITQQANLTATAALYPPKDGFYDRYGKRALDLLLAIPLFVLCLPVIFLAAAAVVLTSGWPPFYAAERVGKDGRRFRMWKIRTMRRDADRLLGEWLREAEIRADFTRSFKLPNDSRTTGLGNLLRRSSLDELPQFLNVIRGEMSLVGHRPVTREELTLHYGADAAELLSMRPGVTGPWQIGGRNAVTYPDRVNTELAYVRSSSMRSDLWILLRTLLVPVRFNGR